MVIEQILIRVEQGAEAFAEAGIRYAVLHRLGRGASRHGVRVLAFGFGAGELRLVVEGPVGAVGSLLRGTKVGTTREAVGRGRTLRFGRSRRAASACLAESIAWAHRAPLGPELRDPLASPWSSHRDLLGFRRAAFFDVGALRDRVDAAWVHELAGGRPLQTRRPGGRPRREPLMRLMRVAAAVLGVLPPDRRCFRLFVHLGRVHGWPTAALARALSLTVRRVRQLAAEGEQALDLAMLALRDPALSVVP